MQYERKGVTIKWEIQNDKYIHLLLYSPVISMEAMDGTKWKLGVRRMRNSTVWLTIKREAEDNGPENFELNYEFSITALHGTSSTVERAYTYTFQKDKKCPEVKVNTGYPDHPKHHEPLPLRAFTIRCKIYKRRGSIPKSDHFFVSTRLRIESCIFIAEAKNFSLMRKKEQKPLKIVFLPTGEKLITVSLTLTNNCNIAVMRMDEYGTYLLLTFNGINKEDGRFFNLKCFIMDSLGNKTAIGKLEKKFTMRTSNIFILPDVTKETLMKNAAQYLPNDTLSFHCELTFSNGIEYEKVENSEYETDTITDSVPTDFASDLKLLICREGLLSDTSLHTATETFPAHTAILSAQSPIFEAMFKTDMKEAIQKCVHIDDVDAETVKRMLVFLYSDTLEELAWKDAVKLYFAADKYMILSLKQKCTEFLKQSIDLSNCCVLLHLADMHQDEDLKKAVQDCIAECDQEVLYCDQWRDLEEKHPHLAINYFRDQYLEKRLFKF